MTAVTETRPRGSTPQRNRRPGSTRADAPHTRTRMSSDSVVSAYIRELANGSRPGAIGLEDRVRDPRAALPANPRRSRVSI
jgi:hypothetical protein